MRTPRRIDANQNEIKRALIKAGCSVQSLASVGKGCPDLLVGRSGKNYLLEVKDGTKPLSQRALTLDEIDWHAAWSGNSDIVHSVKQAFEAVGVGISDGLGVRSSLVRKFWGDPLPCPACGYQPIRTSLLSNECRMWFRFECPNCDHQPARYLPTHGEAVEAWNKLSPHQPPTSPSETEGRPAEKSSGAGEARTKVEG